MQMANSIPKYITPFMIVVVTIYLLASITSVWKTKSVIPSLITAEKKKKKKKSKFFHHR